MFLNGLPWRRVRLLSQPASRAKKTSAPVEGPIRFFAHYAKWGTGCFHDRGRDFAPSVHCFRGAVYPGVHPLADFLGSIHRGRACGGRVGFVATRDLAFSSSSHQLDVFSVGLTRPSSAPSGRPFTQCRMVRDVRSLGLFRHAYLLAHPKQATAA